MNQDHNEELRNTESVDKDQTLAHFQEFTHLDDIDQCVAILESTNWNLDQALQSFFSVPVSNVETSTNTVNEMHIPPHLRGPNTLIEYINEDEADEDNFIHHNLNDILQTTSVPTTTHLPSEDLFAVNKRLLTFNIQYMKEKFTLHITDDQTVIKIKELISEKLNNAIDVKSQKLNGWKNKDQFISDKMYIRDLNLPLENNLYVINTQSLAEDPDINITDEELINVSGSATAASSAALSIDSFELILKIINDNQNSLFPITQTFYRLNFDYHESFLDLRRKIFKLTQIISDNQEWWYYVLNNENKEYDDSDIDQVKQANTMTQLTKLVEDEKLFSIPLTTIISDDTTLSELKKQLDDLTSPNNSNVKTSSSSSMSSNSKLTPLPNSGTSKKDINPVVINWNKPKSLYNKLMFLITVKNSNGFNLNTKKDESATFNQNPFRHLIGDTSKKHKLSDDNDQEMKSVINEMERNVSVSGTENGKRSHKDDGATNDDDDYYANQIDEDDDDLEEDIDDDNFVSHSSSSSPNSKKQKSLISASCTVGDETACTSSFVEEFSKRYGPLMPLFFIGTVGDAIKEALLCPASKRRLLCIYLHSDHTVFCNIFCSKTLCDENVVNFLSSNFVVWPWDLTVKEHENYFYDSASSYLGSVIVSSLKSLKEKFPAFLIVNRVRSTNEVVAIIEGDCTNEQMMLRLMQTFEMFEAQRMKDEQEEHTRDERERIKREQDQAYQASLQMDKAKRQKQTEENEKKLIEARIEEENKKLKLESIETRKRQAQNNVPDEPTEAGAKIASIRFRLPTGDIIQRKFLASHKLESIMDFITGHGYFVEDYKLLSSWPRRDLTAESTSRTLEELKLYPQETLTLEQR